MSAASEPRTAEAAPDLLPARLPETPPATPVDARVLTVDAPIMQDLAARALRAGKGGLSAVGVASLRHGDGATTMARSLASCLATAFGKRVVLVEANLRSPCLRAHYGLQPGAGLSDVLAGQARLANVLRAPKGAGALLILPASTAPLGNPAAIPGRPLRELMAELFGYADLLVFDLAPILPYPDTVQLCASLDGVALVLRAGRSRRSDSRRAMKLLHGEGATVLGAVLNRERSFIPGFVERWL